MLTSLQRDHLLQLAADYGVASAEYGQAQVGPNGADGQLEERSEERIAAYKRLLNYTRSLTRRKSK